MEPNDPATKQDISVLRAELSTELRATEERLLKVIRDSQTEVIRSTFGFASSMDAKLKTSEAGEILLKQRVGVLESRLLEVEKRLNMPPVA
ncbi:MAG: hypothetical protein EXQ52_08660 [Bryobacterales bacterium]|nr:hypothetical protein [Bryobacterales bacterium]